MNQSNSNNSMYLRAFTDLFVRLLRVATTETPTSFEDTRHAINIIIWILSDTLPLPSTSSKPSGATSTATTSTTTAMSSTSGATSTSSTSVVAPTGLRYLSRLIELYNNQSDRRLSSLHSYVLQLASHLRLTHDLLPSYHPLYRLLDDNPLWISFLPTLRYTALQTAMPHQPTIPCQCSSSSNVGLFGGVCCVVLCMMHIK
jgi:hypothetical protein